MDTLSTLPPTETPPPPEKGLSVDEAADFLDSTGLASAVLSAGSEPDPRAEHDPEPIRPPRHETPPPSELSEPVAAPLDQALPPDRARATRDLQAAHAALGQLAGEFQQAQATLNAISANRAALVAQHGANAVVAEEVRLQGILYDLDNRGRTAHGIAEHASQFLNRSHVDQIEARRQADGRIVAARLRNEFDLTPEGFEVATQRAMKLAAESGLKDQDVRHLIGNPDEQFALARGFLARAVREMEAEQLEQEAREIAAKKRKKALMAKKMPGRYAPAFEEGDPGLDAAAFTFRRLGYC